MGVSKNDLEKIIKNIKSVQIRQRVFNFKEFKKLLSLNDKTAEELNGKIITLLLGSTGCGKSTTVHYLCGS
jgi:ABC-type Fe3+/spermidine/putrescine transport system ATPase subunit